MSENLGGYYVFLQDWRTHRFGTAEPACVRTWFPTYQEAVSEKARLRQLNPSPECLLCVGTKEPPRAKPARSKKRRS
jgi:hypothetical protein